VSIVSDDAALKPIIEKHYVPSQGGRSPRQIVKKRIRPLVTDYLMARMMEKKGDESALNEKVRLSFDVGEDSFRLTRVGLDDQAALEPRAKISTTEPLALTPP